MAGGEAGRVALRQSPVALKTIKLMTETANRVRQRIEAVLDWASVHKLRSSDNPARWRGVLDKIYPAPNQISQVRHHPACPYNEAPGVIAQLRQSSNLSSRCLSLLILTATRSGEARGARWCWTPLPVQRDPYVQLRLLMPLVHI